MMLDAREAMYAAMDPPEAVRGLTLHQPWAWAVAVGGKRIENRTWGTDWRGPLVIHAAQRPVRSEDLRMATVWAGRARDAELVRAVADRTRGRVVAVCNLVDVADPDSELGDGDRHWALPGYRHWVLRDVIPLIRTVPATGARGLWKPDAELVQEIRFAVVDVELPPYGGGRVLTAGPWGGDG